MSIITGLIGSVMGVGTKLVTGSGLYYVVGAGVLVLSSGIGIQTWRLHTSQAVAARAEEKTGKAEAATLEVKREWAEQRATMASAAAASSAEFRNREQGYIEQIQKGYSDVAQAKIRNDAILADMRSKHDSELRTLASYAAGTTSGRAASEDTLAACQHRADALGSVLAESVRVQAELGEAAESESSKVAGLLDAWPVNP